MTGFRHSHGPDGNCLARDGNSAAMPPIAIAREFGGISKMKECPQIRGHSNSLYYLLYFALGTAKQNGSLCVCLSPHSYTNA